jgi:hypothetical protein
MSSGEGGMEGGEPLSSTYGFPVLIASSFVGVCTRLEPTQENRPNDKRRKLRKLMSDEQELAGASLSKLELRQAHDLLYHPLSAGVCHLQVVRVVQLTPRRENACTI